MQKAASAAGKPRFLPRGDIHTLSVFITAQERSVLEARELTAPRHQQIYPSSQT